MFILPIKSGLQLLLKNCLPVFFECVSDYCPTIYFREKYKSYKKTEDQLTNELILYQTNTEPYKIDKFSNNTPYKEDSKPIFCLFVSRVESIILKERDDTVEKLTRMSLEQLKADRHM